jgi:hypothetical protein
MLRVKPLRHGLLENIPDPNYSRQKIGHLIEELLTDLL